MLARVGKLVGYTKAPKATFVMRHPVRGTRMWRASRRSRSLGGLAAAGAAALALPLGIWLVRRRG